ncbi:hypothetical protein OIV83_004787 [Microbotryomycetes sp. JL201]|nr:hypothetical protein OIV83_004787 [Microbotryomycetes sp. JL201]
MMEQEPLSWLRGAGPVNNSKCTGKVHPQQDPSIMTRSSTFNSVFDPVSRKNLPVSLDELSLHEASDPTPAPNQDFPANTSDFNMYDLGRSGNPIILDVWGEKLSEMHDFFVAETDSDEILFHLKGPWKWIGLDLALLEGRDGEQVGRVKKEAFEQTHIAVALAGWQADFKRSSALSNTFRFVGPDGAKYAWKNYGLGNSARLFKTGIRDDDTGHQVAKWRVVTDGFKKQNQLIVQPEVATICDAILLTALAFEANAIEHYSSMPAATGRIRSPFAASYEEEDRYGKASYDSWFGDLSERHGGTDSVTPQSFDTYGFGRRGGATSLDVFGRKWTELHEWEVVETGRQDILFHLGGKFKMLGMSLRLTRNEKDGPLVAAIEKAAFKQSEMDIAMAAGWSTRFKRPNILTNTFVFRGPDNQEYKWKQTMSLGAKASRNFGESHIQILVNDNDQVVATWEVVYSGKSKSNRLLIQPPVTFMTDVVLATILAWEAYAVETLRSSTSAGGQAK